MKLQELSGQVIILRGDLAVKLQVIYRRYLREFGLHTQVHELPGSGVQHRRKREELPPRWLDSICKPHLYTTLTACSSSWGGHERGKAAPWETWCTFQYLTI